MAEQARKVDYAEGTAAVQDYLDFMLREATEAVPERDSEREPEHEPEHEPERIQAPVAERQTADEVPRLPVIVTEPVQLPEPRPVPERLSAPPDVPVITEAPAGPADVSAQTDVEAAVETAVDEPAAEAPRVPPQWAEKEFPSLLFQVRGMDMAAPLIHLGGIANISDESLQPVAGQAPWFIGLMRWNGRTIRVVDTARLLVGEKADEAAPADGGRRRGYASMVMLHGTDWALAVDRPGESRRLDPGDIRWRHQRGRRPWLAGTLSGRLCSLLDTGAIIERLAPIAPVSRPDKDAPSLAQNLQDQH